LTLQNSLFFIWEKHGFQINACDKIYKKKINNNLLISIIINNNVLVKILKTFCLWILPSTDGKIILVRYLQHFHQRQRDDAVFQDDPNF